MVLKGLEVFEQFKQNPRWSQQNKLKHNVMKEPSFSSVEKVSSLQPFELVEKL